MSSKSTSPTHLKARGLRSTQWSTTKSTWRTFIPTGPRHLYRRAPRLQLPSRPLLLLRSSRSSRKLKHLPTRPRRLKSKHLSTRPRRLKLKHPPTRTRNNRLGQRLPSTYASTSPRLSPILLLLLLHPLALPCPHSTRPCRSPTSRGNWPRGLFRSPTSARGVPGPARVLAQAAAVVAAMRAVVVVARDLVAVPSLVVVESKCVCARYPFLRGRVVPA